MPFELFSFQELTGEVMYEILNLRNEVFVVEQNCVYLDTDGKDMYAKHLMLRGDDNQLVGYSRILPKGVSYDEYISIGRVVTSRQARGTGAGRLLMAESIKICQQWYPDQPIKIEAQSYLLPFYASFGFIPQGDDYILDGILHREMIRE